MMKMGSFQLVFVLGAMAFFWGSLSAAELAVGDRFPAWEAIDQHEVAYPLPEGVRTVAVAFTMGVGKSANRTLAKGGATFLPERQAVFVANIHGMPSVARVFAMPKMRKYPHRIMLADAEGLLDSFPQKDGQVTVFRIGPDGRITDIRFWDPDDEAARPFE